MKRGNDPWESDHDLVASILAGSVEHFDLLYETYFRRVYRYALKRLRDPAEAEDVTQEVFVTVFRVLPSWKGESSLLVWMFGITRNTVNRRFRKAKMRVTSLDDDAIEVAAAVPVMDDAVEARRLLARCEELVAKDLTPLQRRIFHLRHLRRQSIRNIAEALGKSEDAIKANLYRMRQSLTAAAPGLEGLLSS